MKKFKQVTSFETKNETVKFLLNQAIEWHKTAFTVREMTDLAVKENLYPEDVSYNTIASRVRGFIGTYCHEVNQQTFKERVYEGRKPKQFRIQSKYI